MGKDTLGPAATGLVSIDDIAVAAFAVDCEGRVVLHNQAAAALWGRTPPSGTLWTGALRLLNATGGIVNRTASPAARTLLEGNPPEDFEVLFAERPDGSRAAFLSRPSLLHSADGQVSGVLELMLEPHPWERINKDECRLAGSVSTFPIRDVAAGLVNSSKIVRATSGREAAEARELIQELNHRVRNTLATIQAMAGQSLRRSSSPEAFARSFAGRVQALARVHDFLIVAEMSGADLKAIVNGELSAEGLGMRIVVDGPQVMLEPGVAVQMALVVHELADNARCHGALSEPPGRMTVDWRIEAGPSGMRLVFDWRETGPAALAFAGAIPGSGFLLIEQGLAVNGGTAVRRSEQDGFAWEIVLPLPGLAAAFPSPPDPASSTLLPVAATLEGRRVLVVEDEPMIALDIEAQLAAAGAIVIGPVGVLGTAAGLIESMPLDAALLDATLAGKPVTALALALEARGVPFAFSSGHGPSGLPEEFRDRPLLQKPFTAGELLALIRALLAPAGDTTLVQFQRGD